MLVHRPVCVAPAPKAPPAPERPPVRPRRRVRPQGGAGPTAGGWGRLALGGRVREKLLGSNAQSRNSYLDLQGVSCLEVPVRSVPSSQVTPT